MNNSDDSAAPLSLSAQRSMGVERVALALNGGDAALGEPPRKRAKPAPPAEEEALRRRLLESALGRARALRDSLTDRLSELYFLQAGGNMMDYAVWRKKPAEGALLAFLEARRPREVSAPPPSPADEMLAAAKQEAYVAARVADLARAGLWAERRLPRVLEPPRAKSHWDYLLEEMAWLAQDFAHERKWKKQAAKKCARAVQKYWQDKALAAQKAEKAQELQLKKIAAFAAKEIRTFWNNVEKLAEWKRARRVERARKEALDSQLSYIVDRTERYSRQLAAGLRAPGQPTPPDDDDDEEFAPHGDDADDEETIAAAERDLPHPEPGAELAALRRESRADLADLLPQGYAPAAEDEYGPPSGEDSADDEETIAEQERRERAADPDAELAQLRADADLDLDDLRRRYAESPAADRSDAESTASESSECSSTSVSSSSSSCSLSSPLSALVAEGGVERAATLAASLQPTGTTLSETAVGTPVPALLRHALREYQHVGLHWLATMYARGLNGILADEMGLGKTVQTIALLAHLALDRHDWGPHLVVAPTSVVLNWEMEFKKWCPAFKILTYYGTIKERKLKRVGWTKANSFHVCITSYKLVVQDHQSFRRKRWKYLVLDEAQNIKNFKSQRWQLLLNFQTERRLLLTGTPLQNSLLELWSLMHFLMPDVFASHSEFRSWFGEVSDMAEGGARNDVLVRRLHGVLRPFLLRRLKADVERQMPRKYEHVLLCRLAKRQRYLYDDFMSRAKTRETLASGNLLSVINVLMQLRKVCNHPDLFEPRPVTSPLHLERLRMRAPARALLSEVAARSELCARLGGDLASLEARGARAFAAHRARHLAPPRRLVEELPAGGALDAVRAPPAELRLHLRLVPRAPPTRAAPLSAPPLRCAAAPAAPAAGPIAPPPATCGHAAARLAARRRDALRRLAVCNERRCWRLPLYGADLLEALYAPPPPLPPPLPAPGLEERLRDMHDTIDRFTVCWRACVAPAAELCAGAGRGAREWRGQCAQAEVGVAGIAARAALGALHVPVARQRVAFPHPRLLQFDCGKLQTLARLLRRLKAGGHRVLVFTQMTRVLDVLEAFLSLHGHAYLRLDGATRLDARQSLVDRFNADARVFAFILSTRSGGVGLNLTGADCVVFYDSDWNPTMDAQAQDRCHRIGQTRDVHVYRLVTAATVEENILRKADQKRRLNHLAIDAGHFTTSYLREANIKELFGCTEEGGGAGVPGGSAELETALAAAEDEADAAAATAARAEVSRDLAEFDESVPLHCDDDDPDPPASASAPGHDDLAALMDQLSPIEKYAMRVVEGSEAVRAAECAALGEVRRQLGEWERARAELRDAAPALTYPRSDAQVWSTLGGECMPQWGPPTPPAADGDVYREQWAAALYRPGAAPDTLLPPAARRADRAPPPARAEGRLQHRHARQPHAPLSLFERAGGRRPRAAPPASIATPPTSAATPPLDWTAAEDAALRRALRLQRLPPSPPPAVAPNWEWVAELVGEPARAYRSPRACRDRHDALQDPERARRRRARHHSRRAPADHEPLQRLEAVRRAAERRRAAPRRRPEDAPKDRNPKHAAMLVDHAVDYEAPPTPMEVASRRAERIAREKLKASAPPASPALPPPTPAPLPPPSARPAAPPRAPAPLLYRQQTVPARHLKLLHQAPSHHAQSGGATLEPAALRKFQLQQLALRRAPGPSPSSSSSAAVPPSVAHLAPRTPDSNKQ